MSQNIGKDPAIAIVGGGIGGLTLANALQKQGYERVTVFEQWEHMKTRGGHISIMPAASGGSLPVLEALGLHEKVHAVAPTVRGIKSLANRHVLGEYPISLGPRIMREALQHILLENLRPDTVCLGKALCGFKEEGNNVELLFEDGVTEMFDLVVAADGISSTVSRQLFPDSGKQFSGFVYYACLAKGAYVPEGLFYDHHVHGAGKAFTVRAVSGAGLDGRWDGAYFVVRADTPASSAWDSEGTKEHIQPLLALMREHAGGCPSWLTEIVEKSERVWKWGIYEHSSKPSWISAGGRVVLLGDAAHAMAPFLGLGAQSAMLDAHALAAELMRDQPLADALLAFETQRKGPCEQITRMANFEGMGVTSFGLAAAYRNSLKDLVRKWYGFLGTLSPRWFGQSAAALLVWCYTRGFHASERCNAVFYR